MRTTISRMASYWRNYGTLAVVIRILYQWFPTSFRPLASWALGRGASPTTRSTLSVAASAGRTAQRRYLDPHFDVPASVRDAYRAVRLVDRPTGHGSGKLSVNWYVPDFINVWGGGHYTLFRFATYFSQKNIANTIVIYDNSRHASAPGLLKEIWKAFPGADLRVVVDKEHAPPCDIAIATTWQSAYDVIRVTGAAKKIYFIQDFEPLFYPAGTAYMLAEETYRWGLDGVTGGRWLKDIYEGRYGGHAVAYTFAVDHDIFFPPTDPAQRAARPRVFFYGRPSTDRRAFDLGIGALELVVEKLRDEVEIVTAGGDLSHYRLPFALRNSGSLTLPGTAELYRSCEVGLCFSATNLSYLPLELMASGCAVVTNRGDNVEWYCKDGVNALLVAPSPTDIASAICEVLANEPLRARLVAGGLESTRDRTWEQEMEGVRQYVIS